MFLVAAQQSESTGKYQGGQISPFFFGWSSPVEDNWFGFLAHPLFPSSLLSYLSALPREPCSGRAAGIITSPVPLGVVAQGHILFKVPCHSHKICQALQTPIKELCVLCCNTLYAITQTPGKHPYVKEESDFHLNALILGWWHYIKYSDLLLWKYRERRKKIAWNFTVKI